MMNTLQMQGRVAKPLSLGSKLGAILAGDQMPQPWAPGRVTRREVGAGQPSSPSMPQVGDVSATMPAIIDNSPAGLPPANMPGGNDPTPIQPAQQRTDYAALLNAALGPRPELTGWRKAASIVAPMILAATGNQEGANQMMAGFQSRTADYDRQRRENAMQAVKWGRDDDLAAAKRNEPQYWSGSEDRVRYDPATGTASRVYDAPQDFEDYAATSGYEPGTPEYFRAAEDYVLRGNGPTAFKYDRDLETIRSAGRSALEAERQRNRAALRGMPSYRDLNPPAPRQSAAPRTAAPKTGGRPTATGPNGQKVEWNGTAWVPAS
jgi:hypothetical protein